MLHHMQRTIASDVQGVYGPDVDPDWKRFAQVVAARRSEMGLTQEQVAAMGGPSSASMRLIEAGGQTNYRPQTLYSLDRALGWSPGSHLAVLAGRRPDVLIAAEDFRTKIISQNVAPNAEDGAVYRRRDESALRDAARQLTRALEQTARGIEAASQAARAIVEELEADE